MPRALITGALAAVLCAASAPAHAQQSDSLPSDSPATQLDGRLRIEIALLSRFLDAVNVPAPDRFTVGTRTVPAGSTAQGTVAVARGDLAVHGRIEGDALVLHGDIIVHPGGTITGNAVSVDGGVRPAGGVVLGDIRTIRGITGGILARTAGRPSDGRPLTTWEAIKLVLGWFAVLSAIGIGVLLFAEKNLDGVVVMLERQFSRSFWTGVLAQLAAVPALLLLCIGLAITLLGILLIPFAVVASVIALAGLLTLGFLAAARFTGRAFASRGSSRAVSLRSLLIGLVIYIGLWMLAATFASNAVIGSILRAVALAGSWVALTLGLGATILSRAGTRRDARLASAAAPVTDMSWQTPTPVTGVVAARRPVSGAKERVPGG
jgi:hypothetical protein